MTEPNQIKLRFPGKCTFCRTDLPKGSDAWHFKTEKKVACPECFAPVGADASPGSTPTAATNAPGEQLPGTSARREYERRTHRRQDELQDRWGGRLGKLVWLLEDEKQSTAAWSKGAKGERKVGEYLEKKLDGKGCELLHDRAIPGSRANIDHIAIGPGGVTVIDAKNIKGKVRATTTGIGKRKRTLLTVDGRDRSKLIAGVRRQVDVVEAVLEDLQPPISVPVCGLICWWNHEGLPLIGANKIEVEGIRVLSPRRTADVAGSDGELSLAAVSVVADFLDSRLRLA